MKSTDLQSFNGDSLIPLSLYRSMLQPLIVVWLALSQWTFRWPVEEYWLLFSWQLKGWWFRHGSFKDWRWFVKSVVWDTWSFLKYNRYHAVSSWAWSVGGIWLFPAPEKKYILEDLYRSLNNEYVFPCQRPSLTKLRWDFEKMKWIDSTLPSLKIVTNSNVGLKIQILDRNLPGVKHVQILGGMYLPGQNQPLILIGCRWSPVNGK